MCKVERLHPTAISAETLPFLAVHHKLLTPEVLCRVIMGVPYVLSMCPQRCTSSRQALTSAIPTLPKAEPTPAWRHTTAASLRRCFQPETCAQQSQPAIVMQAIVLHQHACCCCRLGLQMSEPSLLLRCLDTEHGMNLLICSCDVAGGA